MYSANFQSVKMGWIVTAPLAKLARNWTALAITYMLLMWLVTAGMLDTCKSKLTETYQGFLQPLQHINIEPSPNLMSVRAHG